MHGARPMRSTRRLQNLTGQRPGWYAITNSAAGPTQVSIYDEIGFFGVSAADFLNDLRTIKGDIELHLNSPGGDVFDGIAIFNVLRQTKGQVRVIVDGLAASAASFIAQAASPGCLEMAPHSQMMIHDGFAMGIGNAADMRELADQLDRVSNEIASIYAGRSGKPVDYWRGKMQSETWYSDSEAVADGLADRIHGEPDQADPMDGWDLSVFAHFVNADGNHGSMSGTHSHMHPAYGSQGGDAMHSHEHSHDGDANHGHHKKAAPAGDDGDGPDNVMGTTYVPSQYQRSYGDTAQCPKCRLFNATDAKYCDQCGTKLVGRDDVAEIGPNGQLNSIRNADDGPTDLGDGWVCDPDGTVRFDPDGDGDDDSCAEGDTDNDYWDADGNQLQDIPDQPEMSNAATDDDEDAKKPFPGAAPPFKKKSARHSAFPILDADVDDSPWDASKAWAAGAASDDPAAFYRGICAGRKAGDPSTQAAWALPYKYTPSSAPNAAGTRNALSRLPQTKGLTNEDQARATLEKAMKAINPDYDPDDYIDPALLMEVFSAGLEGARK